MKTREIHIGNRVIGGSHPILIQSMCNTKTENVQATVDQILRLEEAGCEIIRVAVPTMEAATAIKEIKKQIHIPLVADIHFDYRLALAAIENGVDKIRINPGNIGNLERIQMVVDACKKRNIVFYKGNKRNYYSNCTFYCMCFNRLFDDIYKYITAKCYYGNHMGNYRVVTGVFSELFCSVACNNAYRKYAYRNFGLCIF